MIDSISILVLKAFFEDMAYWPSCGRGPHYRVDPAGRVWWDDVPLAELSPRAFLRGWAMRDLTMQAVTGEETEQGLVKLMAAGGGGLDDADAAYRLAKDSLRPDLPAFLCRLRQRGLLPLSSTR